ncbi:unnamed protein product [Dibothriocephalus latus]|uniref:Phosphatidylserine synthase n=1 Tax=Dibothriocephalus latus TaxID=60516 RepID=A0A3P7LCN0_DIBLA|nr:unnamed protein product [Dibothriocephalus latus]
MNSSKIPGAKVGRFQGLRRRLFSESSVDKEYFKKNIEQQPVEDITLNIFYQSRSITILIVIVAALTWVAFTRQVSSKCRHNLILYLRSTGYPLEDDLFHGALCVITVFLIISVMIMPNGPFTRPHPLVWRVVFGASLLYFLSIVFVLFLRLEDARKILFYLDPALRKMRHCDILDKEYAVNCSQVRQPVLFLFIFSSNIFMFITVLSAPAKYFENSPGFVWRPTIERVIKFQTVRNDRRPQNEGFTETEP